MRINECAKTLNDGKLLAKLSGRDVIAQELKYHSACLVALYNEEQDYLRVQDQERAQENWKEAYPIAFSEPVTHISGKKSCQWWYRSTHFQADLTTLYKQRLEQLGVESPQVHATRLKDQRLCHIPELQAHHQGRDVMLAFEKDVGSILAQASKYGEAIHLAKAAGMIRQDMLNLESHFSSMFNNADRTGWTTITFAICMRDWTWCRSPFRLGPSGARLPSLSQTPAVLLTGVDPQRRDIADLLVNITPHCSQLSVTDKCCCQKGCNRRCKCFRSGLPCTALCCICDQ